MKSVLLLVMLILVVAQTQVVMIKAQANCASALTSLNTCAPFVVPGAATTTPNSDCCTALQSVDHDCLCNTLRIAARIPTQCNLPALSCTG